MGFIFAATTLLEAGFEVSTLDLVVLPLVAVDAFLLTRDFFSIAIVLSPKFDFLLPYTVTTACEVPNSLPPSTDHRGGDFGSQGLGSVNFTFDVPLALACGCD